MRKILWPVAAGLAVCNFTLAQTAQTNPFAGNWVNSDANATELNMLYITKDAGSPGIQAFLRCGVNDCDLGMRDMTFVASSPDQTAVTYGHAEFGTDYGWLYVDVHLDGGLLVADIFKWYQDDNGHVSFRMRNLMRLGPSTPILISPDDGTSFTDGPPRTTLFKWNAAQGAATYGIEVDWAYPDDTWASDQNKSYIKEGLTDTTYSFSFVGAQPGRWRVWSIAANGDKSPKSDWWEFSYQH